MSRGHLSVLGAEVLSWAAVRRPRLPGRAPELLLGPGDTA